MLEDAQIYDFKWTKATSNGQVGLDGWIALLTTQSRANLDTCFLAYSYDVLKIYTKKI